MSDPGESMSDLLEITPNQAYQIDSDEYASEQDDDVAGSEYDALVDEAENGYSNEETAMMITELREKGLVTFLRWYLTADGEGNERSLRKLLLGLGVIPPINLRHPSTPNSALLSFTTLTLTRILRKRAKLPNLNTPQDVLDLLRTSKNILILSGAGISTSCGIPDFRSVGGLYAQLKEEWDLNDPQEMFDIEYFRERPEVFYSFAKKIYPSNFQPSPCHRWIKMLEDRGILLRNYTQNIDTLETQAGVGKVLQCHGSFATASCLRCKTTMPGKRIEENIMNQTVPYCGICSENRDKELAILKASKGKGKARQQDWRAGGSDDEEGDDEWGGGEPGIIKPDITFFGQALASKFEQCLHEDREKVDLLIIIGTSLKVAPVSEVLTHIPHSVPQVFINLTPVSHVIPDICLLGDADSIVTWLSKELGWSIPASTDTSLSPDEDQVTETSSLQPVGVPPEHVSWISGVGEMQHIHLLTDSRGLEEKQDVEAETMGIDDSAGSIEVESSKLDSGAAFDRPSKRSRKEDI